MRRQEPTGQIDVSGMPVGSSSAFPWAALLAALAPGALFGAHLVALLHFLNPQLPVDFRSILRELVLYVPVGALAAALVVWPWARFRPRRWLRVLPWSLTVVLALVAILAGLHASHYAFYLPPGMNRRLIKTAAWLSVGALAGFYTALLHTFNRRSYRWRSRWTFAALALISLLVVVERRAAFQPPTPRAPRPTLVEGQVRPRLLFVALDSATLEAILPLAEQEQLPFFSELLREGAHGRLETVKPGTKEVLWATAATGRWPYQHGILGHSYYPAPLNRNDAFLSLLPVGLSFSSWGVFGAEPQPVDATWLKVLPLWTILSRLGYETGIVGYRTLDPVPQESRFAFSHKFFLGARGQRWSHPELLAERALLFRTTPSEISWDHVDGFGEKIPRTLKSPLAGDLWREAVTLFLLEQDQEVDALFLYLPGLRTASSRFFGGFADLQFDGKTNPRTHNANTALSSYYQHLDSFLQKLWSLPRGPRMLAVVSACGASRPTGAMKVRNWIRRGRSTRGLVDQGEDGLLILRGEGVRPGASMARSNIVDVTPTLLYGLGLPVARDLPGQILTEAFDPGFLAHRPLTFVPSYEALGESPR